MISLSEECESHLQEFSDAADFITKKFDTYEQEGFITKKFDTYKQQGEKREEIITNLMENVSRLAQSVYDLSIAVEKQKQYSRRNCFLLHRIPEKKQENTEKLCIKLINKHLDLAINDRDISRTHRIGNPRNAGKKPTPLIIKIVRYNVRKKFFDSKKKLKAHSLVNLWQLKAL